MQSIQSNAGSVLEIEGRVDPFRGLARAEPEEGSDRKKVVQSIESLLGYLAVVARGLARDDQAGLDDASDLVQMTVVAALGNVAQGKLPEDRDGAPKSWLRGIMLNLWRQQWKHKRPVTELGDEEVVAETTSPSVRASRKELIRLMARARAGLNERDRRILDWRHEEKLTFEAIGQHLGVTSVAAHKSYGRALKRLELSFLQVTGRDAYGRAKG